MNKQEERIAAAKGHLRIRGFIATNESCTTFKHKDDKYDAKFKFQGPHITTTGTYCMDIHKLYETLKKIINGY